MTRYVTGKRSFGAKTTPAIMALLAGGYLLMSGVSAEPAAGEDSDVTHTDGKRIDVPSGVVTVIAKAQADVPSEGSGADQKDGSETVVAKVWPPSRPARAAKRPKHLQTHSNPVRSTKPGTMPRSKLKSTAVRVRSSRRARCLRSAASNTRPAYTTRAAPFSVNSILCCQASPFTATGERRSLITTTTARKLPRSRPG